MISWLSRSRLGLLDEQIFLFINHFVQTRQEFETNIFDECFKTLLLKLQDINDSSSNRSVDMDISESAPASQNVNQGSILREGDVGQITDTEVPLVHAVRLLCSRFLLTGHPMGLIPDRQVNAPLVK